MPWLSGHKMLVLDQTTQKSDPFLRFCRKLALPDKRVKGPKSGRVGTNGLTSSQTRFTVKGSEFRSATNKWMQFAST